jgi:DNA-binding CsgD family transcriptional regulator/PAS domain-containing protein
MARELAADDFSSLAGRIYDCILTPANWPSTIEDIRTRLGFANGVLGTHSSVRPSHLFAAANIDVPSQQSALSYARELPDIWGGAAMLGRHRLAEPVVASRITTRKALSRSRFYREWCRPRGIGDAVTMQLYRDGDIAGAMTFGQFSHDGAIRASQVELLQTLAPHLHRAATIGNVFKISAARAATFEATVDTWSVGVLLVDDALTVIEANQAAQAILDCGDVVAVRRGRMELRSAAAQKSLHAAVLRMVGEPVASDIRQASIGVPRADGDLSHIQLRRIERQTPFAGMARKPVVAVLISAAATAPLPDEAMACFYALTPGETSIFRLVVAGKQPSEVSAALGLKVSTVKTHLVRIFAKTGVQRQADLVRLAASLAMPV